MRPNRHLDRRLAGLPCDYVEVAQRFGVDDDVGLVVPDGGDRVSAEVAWQQHRLVLAWRGRGCQPSAAALCRRFGFSKQTWSRTVLGQRWAGQLLLAALLQPSTAGAGASRRVERGRR